MGSGRSFISQELQEPRPENFVWYFGLNLGAISQSLASELQMVQTCSKLAKQPNQTFIYGLTSQKLQRLGHFSFAWYFNLNLATFSLGLVCQIQNVWKCSKLEKRPSLTFNFKGSSGPLSFACLKIDNVKEILSESTGVSLQP